MGADLAARCGLVLVAAVAAAVATPQPVRGLLAALAAAAAAHGLVRRHGEGATEAVALALGGLVATAVLTGALHQPLLRLAGRPDDGTRTGAAARIVVPVLAAAVLVALLLERRHQPPPPAPNVLGRLHRRDVALAAPALAVCAVAALLVPTATPLRPGPPPVAARAPAPAARHSAVTAAHPAPLTMSVEHRQGASAVLRLSSGFPAGPFEVRVGVREGDSVSYPVVRLEPGRAVTVRISVPVGRTAVSLHPTTGDAAVRTVTILR